MVIFLPPASISRYWSLEPSSDSSAFAPMESAFKFRPLDLMVPFKEPLLVTYAIPSISRSIIPAVSSSIAVSLADFRWISPSSDPLTRCPTFQVPSSGFCVRTSSNHMLPAASALSWPSVSRTSHLSAVPKFPVPSAVSPVAFKVMSLPVRLVWLVSSAFKPFRRLPPTALIVMFFRFSSFPASTRPRIRSPSDVISTSPSAVMSVLPFAFSFLAVKSPWIW